MHPATMQALAAQRGSDLRADGAAARRARQARRSQPVEQHGQFSTTGPRGAALSTRFCQTLAVVSNSDAASSATPEPRSMPELSPLRGLRRWTLSGLSGFRSLAGSPTEP